MFHTRMAHAASHRQVVPSVYTHDTYKATKMQWIDAQMLCVHVDQVYTKVMTICKSTEAVFADSCEQHAPKIVTCMLLVKYMLCMLVASGCSSAACSVNFVAETTCSACICCLGQYHSSCLTCKVVLPWCNRGGANAGVRVSQAWSTTYLAVLASKSPVPTYQHQI